jgi:phosphomannomutase/phosphoglucomutase
MTQVDTSVFRKYDIRGTVAGDNIQITPDLARLVGKALGTYLPREFGTDHMFVGQDNRASSQSLRMALMEGVASTGMNVTNIGEVMTPTVYFASASYGDKGAGVMITGSHLATKYNGIKMAYGALALADQQILDLLKIIQDDSFAVGQGKVDSDFNMLHEHMEKIKSMVKIERPLKVVLDAGNGMSGVPVTPMLADLVIVVT